MQDLPVILKWHNFQGLEKALKFCKSDVYFLVGEPEIQKLEKKWPESGRILDYILN